MLKRLGVTPLGRPRLLGAKLVATLAIELVQLVVLGVAAVLLGWDPSLAAGAGLGAVVLGTARLRRARPAPWPDGCGAR